MPRNEEGVERWPKIDRPKCKKRTPSTPDQPDRHEHEKTNEHTATANNDGLPSVDTTRSTAEGAKAAAIQPSRLPEFSAGNLERQRAMRFVGVFAESGGGDLIAHLGSCFLRISRAVVKDNLTEYLQLTEQLRWITVDSTPEKDKIQESIPWRIYLSPSVQGRPALKSKMRLMLSERYVPDTKRVAEKYYRFKVPDHSLLEQEDVVAAAIIGMLQYIDKYDPAVGCTFMQFANAKGKSRIQGSITDHLRILMDCTRTASFRRRIIAPMVNDLRHELGRDPSTDDFVDRYGETWREWIEDFLFGKKVYNQGRDSESVDQMSMVRDTTPSHEWELNDEDSQKFYERIESTILDSRPPRCNERHVFSLFARYYLGWTNKKIATHPVMNCSQALAAEIRKEAERKLKIYHKFDELNDLLYKDKNE